MEQSMEQFPNSNIVTTLKLWISFMLAEQTEKQNSFDRRIVGRILRRIVLGIDVLIFKQIIISVFPSVH